MFDRLIAYLNQPYPFNAETKNYLKVILVFTAFVAGFLALFRPFDIGLLPEKEVYIISISFGLVTFFHSSFSSF